MNHDTLVYTGVADFGEIKLSQLTGNPNRGSQQCFHREATIAQHLGLVSVLNIR